MATLDQMHQLIALIATASDHEKWPDSKKFQRLLGLPRGEFDIEFAALLHLYQPPEEISMIQISELPNYGFPDWTTGEPVFTGVKTPKVIDLSKVRQVSDAITIARVGEQTIRIVLSQLVRAYRPDEHGYGARYKVEATDKLNGHYGLRELWALAMNWKNLPLDFRQWAKGQRLYGLRDAVGCGSNHHGIALPFLNCRVSSPCVDWSDTDVHWFDGCKALASY